MSKKTETLEIRISPELKTRLGQHVDAQSQSMSMFVRSLIQEELSGSQTRTGRIDTMTRSPLSAPRSFMLAGASILLLGAVATFVQGSPVVAQATVRAVFAELDYNGDGIVTPEEFDAWNSGLAEELEELNDEAMADERVLAACAAEFAAGTEEAMEAFYEDFGTYDLNGDGKAVFGEVQNVMSKDIIADFVESDTDGDGLIDLKEFGGLDIEDLETAETEAAEMEDVSEACLVALEAAEPEEEEAFDEEAFLREIRVDFAIIDQNQDGKLSTAEYLAQ